MKQIATAFLLSVLLVQPALAQEPSSAAIAVIRQGQACLIALNSDPRHAGIRQHIPAGRPLANGQHRNDRARLSRAEAEELRRYLGGYRVCLDTMRHQFAVPAPFLAAVMTASIGRLQNIEGDISARRSNWGGFVRDLLALQDLMQNRMLRAQRLAERGPDQPVSAPAAECGKVLPENLAHSSAATGLVEDVQRQSESATAFRARMTKLFPGGMVIAHISHIAGNAVYHQESETLTIRKTAVPYDLLHAITVIPGLGTTEIYSGTTASDPAEPIAGGRTGPDVQNATGLVWAQRKATLQPPGDISIFVAPREARALRKRLQTQIIGTAASPYFLISSLLPGKAARNAYDQAVVIAPRCAALFDPVTGKVYAAWSARSSAS